MYRPFEPPLSTPPKNKTVAKKRKKRKKREPVGKDMWEDHLSGQKRRKGSDALINYRKATEERKGKETPVPSTWTVMTRNSTARMSDRARRAAIRNPYPVASLPVAASAPSLRDLSGQHRRILHMMLRNLLKLLMQWPGRILTDGCPRMPGCTPTCDDDKKDTPNHCIFGKSYQVLLGIQAKATNLFNELIPARKSRESVSVGYAKRLGRIALGVANLMSNDAITEIVTAPLKSDYGLYRDLTREELADELNQGWMDKYIKRSATTTPGNWETTYSLVERESIVSVLNTLQMIGLYIPQQLQYSLKEISDKLNKWGYATSMGLEGILCRMFASRSAYTTYMIDRMSHIGTHRQMLALADTMMERKNNDQCMRCGIPGHALPACNTKAFDPDRERDCLQHIVALNQ